MTPSSLGNWSFRDLKNEPIKATKFIKKAIELDSDNPEHYLYAEILV